MNTWGGENPYITAMQNNSSMINFGYGYNDPYAMQMYYQQPQLQYGYDQYGNECCYDNQGNQYFIDQNGNPYYFDCYGNQCYGIIPQQNNFGWNNNVSQYSDWDFNNYSQYGNDIGNNYICGYDPGLGYRTPGHNEFGFSTVDPYVENVNKVVNVSYDDRFKPNKGITITDKNGNLTADNLKYTNPELVKQIEIEQPKTFNVDGDFFDIPDDYKYDPSEDIMVPNDDDDWEYDFETNTYRPPSKPKQPQLTANANQVEINQNLINAGYTYDPNTHSYERDVSKTFLSDLMKNCGPSSATIVATTDTSGMNNGYIYNGDYYNPYINTNKRFMTQQEEEMAMNQYVCNFMDTVALNHVRRDMPIQQQQYSQQMPTEEELNAQYQYYQDEQERLYYARLEGLPDAVDHGAIMYANRFGQNLAKAKQVMPDDMSFADTLEALTDLAVQEQRRENKRQRFNGYYNKSSFRDRLFKEIESAPGKANRDKAGEMNSYYGDMFKQGCRDDREYANLIRNTGQDPINEYARQKLEFMRLAALNPHDPNNKLN